MPVLVRVAQTTVSCWNRAPLERVFFGRNLLLMTHGGAAKLLIYYQVKFYPRFPRQMPSRSTDSTRNHCRPVSAGVSASIMIHDAIRMID